MGESGWKVGRDLSSGMSLKAADDCRSYPSYFIQANRVAFNLAGATPTTGSDPIANEKIVWDLVKSKNYDAFADLLAADFMEVEPDNVYDKAASVKGVSMFNASKAVLSDFKTVNIDADAAIVTYSVTNPGVSPGPERHSSIWVNRNGKWMGLFHHGGTPVVKAPATPAASASPTVR